MSGRREDDESLIPWTVKLKISAQLGVATGNLMKDSTA